MATIVKHIPTGRRFLLVGTGHDAYHPEPSTMPPSGVRQISEDGQNALAAVCDEDGAIYWCETKELKVESVDGHTPQEILAEKP
ncbi:MAG: hypothetical protein P9L94_07875 [Candidatus Hinthialibacter antarcticus]|nr:hypothetical protein [Candidatus Hinthialibacter antarcticus]